MPTTLHQDFSDPNIVIDCAQRASAAGFSVFGVEAGGQCFSGANAGVTFKKHGQAPDGDCINGEGANFRMSVYKFGISCFNKCLTVDFVHVLQSCLQFELFPTVAQFAGRRLRAEWPSSRHPVAQTD